MRRFERRSRQAGFAYLWMLLAVSALAIGLGVVLEVDATAERREKEAQLLAIGEEFRLALESYYRVPSPLGVHEFPERLKDLLEDDRSGSLQRHLRKIYVDPMTGRAEWGLVRIAGAIVAIHSLSNASPIRQHGSTTGGVDFKGKNSYQEWIFGPSVGGVEIKNADHASSSMH